MLSLLARVELSSLLRKDATRPTPLTGPPGCVRWRACRLDVGVSQPEQAASQGPAEDFIVQRLLCFLPPESTFSVGPTAGWYLELEVPQRGYLGFWRATGPAGGHPNARQAPCLGQRHWCLCEASHCAPAGR
jgi:hypothetical protein